MKLRREQSRIAVYSSVKALTDLSYNLIQIQSSLVLQQWMVFLGHIVETLFNNRFLVNAGSLELPGTKHANSNPSSALGLRRNEQHRTRLALQIRQCRRGRPRERTGGLTVCKLRNLINASPLHSGLLPPSPTHVHYPSDKAEPDCTRQLSLMRIVFYIWYLHLKKLIALYLAPCNSSLMVTREVPLRWNIVFKQSFPKVDPAVVSMR